MALILRKLLRTTDMVVYHQENGNLSVKPVQTSTDLICVSCGSGKKPFVSHEPHYFRILESQNQKGFADSMNQGYFEKFFIQMTRLGRGKGGMVFLCSHMLDGIELGKFAVKAVPCGSTHQWLVKMLREVLLLGKLSHPNVIAYKHAWLENRALSPFAPEVPTLFILMELANGGNLEEYIEPGLEQSPVNANESATERVLRKRSGFSFPQIYSTGADIYGGIGVNMKGKRVRYLKSDAIKSLFLDICRGLSHLHANNIIHRDLKPPNLLLTFDADRNGLPRVMISDFGECELISAEARSRSGGTGTLEFMAPELLVMDVDGTYIPNQSPSIDIWSLGVLLYYLCFSTVPYTQTEDVDELKTEIGGFDAAKMVFPKTERVGGEYRDAIRSMLAAAALRPTITEILDLFEPTEVVTTETTGRIERVWIVPLLLPVIPTLLFNAPKPVMTVFLSLAGILFLVGDVPRNFWSYSGLGCVAVVAILLL